MPKINVLFANANKNLKNQENIASAIKKAEGHAFEKLKIDWDIDVIVTSSGPDIAIPEDHVGGHVYESDFIIMRVEDGATESAITETLVHELCHAARWGKNDEWMNTLFDAIIFEGLATYFEAEFYDNINKHQFFTRTIMERPDSVNEEILEKLRDKLDDKKYDYGTIFFTGDKELPRWSAYSLGYYLVKRYLGKTNKTIEDAFVDKYSDFKIALD